MKHWLEMAVVLVIVGGAAIWAVRRFLAAKRKVESASPCDSCGKAGTCLVDPDSRDPGGEC